MSHPHNHIGRIIAKAWADETFKRQLLANPSATLAAEGIVFPAGMTVHIVENTDTAATLVLPAKPTGELSDAALDQIAGGPTAVEYAVMLALLIIQSGSS